jgi:tetratricopeptide (TPR) repeat protein
VGDCLFGLKQYALALDHLDQAFQTDPESVRAIINLEQKLNSRAWDLTTAEIPQRDPTIAVRLASLSVALDPGASASLNTLGVALYRAGRYAEAIEPLRKSLTSGKGQFAGFDLFFLAMAHHRLGHDDEARTFFDRANRWLRDQRSLPEQYARELAAFEAEAESVLSDPAVEFPADVF